MQPYHSIMGTRIQAFERKHGHWKFTRVLPMFLMVLSCINVTTVQAASIQFHTARPTKMKSPHVSSIHLAFLFDKWKDDAGPGVEVSGDSTSQGRDSVNVSGHAVPAVLCGNQYAVLYDTEPTELEDLDW